MKSDCFFESIIPLFGFALGVALFRRVIRFLKTGSTEWHSGEQFRVSKSEAPIAFWIMIIMYLTIGTILVFGSVRWVINGLVE